LPDDVLARIYVTSFERFAGSAPKPLDANLAADECDRIAAEVAVITDRRAEDTDAAHAAKRLAAFE
jgi:hypothetical protein